jgi:signal transduction histidine kinase
MRSFLPDSIAGRTMVVLLVGLTLSHIAGTAVLSSDRHDAVVAASERLCAERIAVTASMIDKAAPGDRLPLIAQLGGALMTVNLAGRPKVADAHISEDRPQSMQAALSPYFGEVDAARLRVGHREAAGEGHASEGGFWHRLLNGFPRDQIMEVSFRLGDGGWANFDMAMARSATLWSPHSVVSTLVMMAAIVVFGTWATGWVGRPLAAFAAAADRLGRDVNAAPLCEDGPAEVRRAVAAFNGMQGRIRRFVEDRTHMLAAISHDLRSPITRLRLRTETLAEGEARERMLSDLDEMAAMVASTLDFARGEAADEPSQVIDLAATLASVCDNATDVGLAASYEWQGRLVCTCRPAALKRALANLIENGARYGRQASVRTRRPDHAVEVVIEDRGPGIAEAEMEKVFAPFYRLEGSRNRKTGGIGLGLTVARTVVRSHGGDIRLENRPEGGLRVTVTIPQEGRA